MQRFRIFPNIRTMYTLQDQTPAANINVFHSIVTNNEFFLSVICLDVQN